MTFQNQYIERLLCYLGKGRGAALLLSSIYLRRSYCIRHRWCKRGRGGLEFSFLFFWPTTKQKRIEGSARVSSWLSCFYFPGTNTTMYSTIACSSSSGIGGIKRTFLVLSARLNCPASNTTLYSAVPLNHNGTITPWKTSVAPFTSAIFPPPHLPQEYY